MISRFLFVRKNSVAQELWWFGLATFFLLSTRVMFCQQVESCTHEVAHANLVITPDSDDYNKKIEDFFIQPFNLQGLTFSSDVYIEKDEFNYLVDLSPDFIITPDQIKKAIFYLVAKNKFNEIRLYITDKDDGKHLHFEMTGFWTFKNLKIRGILLGKEACRQHYVMEPGDRFDQEKHDHSLLKIQDAFKQGGYFNGSVKSSFSYDEKTKDVTVSIHIEKGRRFVINKAHLCMQAEDCASQDELLFIKNDLYRRFIRRLEGNKYESTILNQLAQTMKKYLAQKGFLHVSIELEQDVKHKSGEVTLIWHIILHHKRTFVFWGNRALSSSYLLDNILMFGRSAWLLPASILAEEIERAYHERGYWQAAIESQEDDDRYFFIINEGMRARIKEVVLKNVVQLDPKIIIGQCFKDMLKKTYYTKQLLDQAFDSFTNLYMKHGFFEAKIIGYEYLPINGQNEYKLQLTIDEGTRSYLSRFSIKTEKEIASLSEFQIIQKRIQVAQKKGLPGIPFTPQVLQDQQRLVLDYFHRQGYIHATIKPKIIKSDDGSVKITWLPQLESKIHFGKTVIAGSSTFPFRYVMREVVYKESTVWDQEKLRQSFLNIKDLEVFDSIQFIPFAINEKGQKKQPVLLKIKKDDPFEVRLRTGLELQQVRKYTTFEGITYKMGGAFIFKNPFNLGDQLRLDGDFTRSHREVVGTYNSPWFFKVPIRNKLQGYSIKHNHPGFIGSTDNIYSITRQGFLVSLQKRNTHVDSSINIGAEWIQTKICDDDLKDVAQNLARAINFEQSLLGKTVPFFVIEPTIFVDLLDNKLDPTRGGLLLLSLKGMISLDKERSNLHYLKFLVEQSFFWPFGPVVGAFRLRFGHIFHNRFNVIMPNERFYLGGSHSIRSYEIDFAPPLGEFCNNQKQCFVPRGGKSMINVNIELRMPLFKHVGLVLFQDLGALSNDKAADILRQKLLAGTGFGLRYNTPIGPLRFDIGWKWQVQRPAERSFAWFFTFGQAF